MEINKIILKTILFTQILFILEKPVDAQSKHLIPQIERLFTSSLKAMPFLDMPVSIDLINYQKRNSESYGKTKDFFYSAQFLLQAHFAPFFSKRKPCILQKWGERYQHLLYPLDALYAVASVDDFPHVKQRVADYNAIVCMHPITSRTYRLMESHLRRNGYNVFRKLHDQNGCILSDKSFSTNIDWNKVELIDHKINFLKNYRD